MKLSPIFNVVAIVCQALLMVYCLYLGDWIGVIPILAALPLLIIAIGMLRKKRKAYGYSALLLTFYAGFFLAFRNDPGYMPAAILSTVAFIAVVVFMRFSFREGNPPPL